MRAPVFQIAKLALTFSLALWVGALVGFAFVFAPAAFATIGPTPEFAMMIARVLWQLSAFAFGCCAVGLLCALVLVWAGSIRQGALIALLLALMATLSAYEIVRVVPRMQATPIRTPAYERLHARSSKVYGCVLIAGLLALGLAASIRNKGVR